MSRRETACCKVDAIVNIDSKGQVVLPKDVREKMKLKPNDKLALIGYERNGKTCCVLIIKAEELENRISNILAPILKNIVK